jgi:DNA gyrase subunit A
MVVGQQRDRVVPRLIEDEMKKSFLDYSMSVIVQRALPDVRDGLKPVHRRILYAMHENGLLPNRPFKKSATVVGDVLGKYHPHGDASVYDALVRMVQDFSLRYPLVQGQGNFGSIDGDSAAAYRYTEARLSPIATELLADIDKETVDFAPNFDDRLTEPTVLPARVPNLLINGSSGIAVGMSTNIPPHNLREVVRAAIHLLDDPECEVEDLLRHLPGPDFPTGGVIVGRKGIRDAYMSGRGRVVVRGRVKREQKRGGREQLVVTEIPYATSKTRILEQIADLVRKSRVDDISDLRDESDRDGIRIVIELKRGAKADRVLELLFKGTALQSTFGVISLALDGGVPREFSLKEILERFRDHRVEVVVRRSRWELERARDEEHVLEGLLVALKHIDRVVQLIRSSRNRETAAAKLRKEFKLTERQAEAILNMRLVRLTALERKDLQNRLTALRVRILELEEILADPGRQLAVVREELAALGEEYGDDRRTRIIEEGAYTLEALEAEEEVVVSISAQGFVKAVPMALFRRRSGAGEALIDTDRYEGDYLRHAFVTNTRDTLLLFTEEGRGYALGVGDVPEAGRGARGRPLHQLLGHARGVRLATVIPQSRTMPDATMVFASRDGTIKRTPLDQFTGLRAGGAVAMTLQTGDRLVDVLVSDGTADIILGTRRGRVIRFPEADVSEVGRTAQGVRGIRLTSGDRVISMLAVRRESSLCTVTERGFVKQSPASDFAPQKRGGLGIVATPTARDTGSVILFREILEGEVLSLISNSGRGYRISAETIPLEGPGSAGAQLVAPEPGESLLDSTVATSRPVRPVPEPEADAALDPDAEGELVDEREELVDEGEELAGQGEERADSEPDGGTPEEQYDLL